MSAKRILKDYALLWAMVAGTLLQDVAYKMAFLLPYSLFVMLALTYTRIAPRDLRFTRSHLWLFVAQTVISVLLFFSIFPYDPLLAQGLALIAFTPTATSASVITAMMGGSMSFVTAYLIPGNVVMAFVAPLFISWLYPGLAGDYLTTVWQILSQVAGLLILPMVVIWALRYGLPRVHDRLSRYTGLTFYVWCLMLVIVTSNTIHFFKINADLNLQYSIIISVSTLLVCMMLFGVGRAVARYTRCSEVNGGQTMGQKNTVLAIWIAMTFMSPVISVIPSFYVIWQNIINSIELAAYQRRLRK